MSIQLNNIYQITTEADLRHIMTSSRLSMCAFVDDKTPEKIKRIIKKFMKEKAKITPNVVFVYTDVSTDDYSRVNILKGDNYPKIYHIIDGFIVIVEVLDVDYEGLVDSYNSVENIYLRDKKDFLEVVDSIKADYLSKMDKAKEQLKPLITVDEEEEIKLKKILLLNQTRDDLLIDTIDDIKKRKEVECEFED